MATRDLKAKMTAKRNKISLMCALTLLTLLTTLNLEAQTAQVSASGVRKGIPVGLALTITIQSGDSYSSYAETYAAQITVLQIIRGEGAWSLIKEASASNKPPKPDSEYLVARIRFSYSSKTAPGDKSYLLRENMFSAFSEDGAEYDPVSIVYPKANLDAKLYPGDTVEGWVAFMVTQKDLKPSMTFGSIHRFQLY